MGLLAKLLGKNEATEENRDPWAEAVITQDKIRDLIRARVKFVGQDVKAAVPDLSEKIKEMAKTELQKNDVRRIWREEVQAFLGTQYKMPSTKRGGGLLD